MTLKCEKKKRNQQCLKLHTGNVVSGYIEKLKPLGEFRSVLLDRKNYTWKNNRASLVAQMVKNPPAMRKIWVLSLGWEYPLEEGMATYSSILAWRIPWTGEPGGLQSRGVAKSQIQLSDQAHILLDKKNYT